MHVQDWKKIVENRHQCHQMIKFQNCYEKKRNEILKFGIRENMYLDDYFEY